MVPLLHSMGSNYSPFLSRFVISVSGFVMFFLGLDVYSLVWVLFRLNLVYLYVLLYIIFLFVCFLKIIMTPSQFCFLAFLLVVSLRIGPTVFCNQDFSEDCAILWGTCSIKMLLQALTGDSPASSTQPVQHLIKMLHRMLHCVESSEP